MIFVLLVLAVWCWVDVRPRGRLDPNNPQEHRTDFTVYTAAGKAAISGLSPYSVSNARGWTYLYLPLFSLLVSPLAFLSEAMQCTVWFWLSVACLYGALREFNNLNRWAFPRSSNEKQSRFVPWGGILCVLGFSLSSLNCLQRGQVGLLQFYLTLLGARLILTTPKPTHAFLGGGVLASAIVLKMSPALPASVLLLTLVSKNIGWRPSLAVPFASRPLSMSLGLFIGLLAGIWLLPSAIVGWQSNQTYLNEWRHDVLSRSNNLSNDQFAGDSHSLRNQSPMNGFWLMGNVVAPTNGAITMDQPTGKLVLQCVRWSAVLLTAIAIIAILLHGKENDVLIAFAVANAATLFVIPIARGHYFMAMWPATVWVPRWIMLSNARGFQLASRLILFIPPLLLILHYAFEFQLGALGVLGVGVWLWLVLLTITLVVFVFSRNVA